MDRLNQPFFHSFTASCSQTGGVAGRNDSLRNAATDFGFHQQRGRQQPRHQRHHRGNRQQHRHSHRQQPHSDQHCWQSSRQSPYIITSGDRFAVWIEQSCVTVRYDGIRDAASDHTFDVIGHVRGRARGGEGRERGEGGRVCRGEQNVILFQYALFGFFVWFYWLLACVHSAIGF